MFIGKKLLIPKTDVVFNRLFQKGNENIAKNFIQTIIKEKIKTIDLDKDRNISDEFIEKKVGIVDFKATLNDNTVCHMEIQLMDQYNIEKRALFYWSRIYSRQLNKGEDYDNLQKTISIIVLDYELKKLASEKYYTKWQIIETQNRKLVLTEDFELYIIEIPRALKEGVQDDLGRWLMFLDNPNSMEVQKMVEEKEDIKEAMEKLEELSNDEHLRWLAELREKAIRDEKDRLKGATLRGMEKGIQEGEKAGQERGRKQRELEIAKNMLKEGLDLQLISKVTGLTIQEIQDIEN